MSEAEATTIIDETASKFIEFFKAMLGQKAAIEKLGELARKNNVPISALKSQFFRRVIELSEQEQQFDVGFLALIKESAERTLGVI